MAEPILRWAGGKRQILDEIIPRLPPKSQFNEYYEPFFGGGAVFFALEPSNGHINDINSQLMNFYSEFRDNNPNVIIEENKKLDDELEKRDTEKSRKDYYYKLREEFNEIRDSDDSEDKFRSAILFLFLNRTCWNGLYRTNEKGEFNVPMKEGVILTESIEKQLRQGYRVLQNTQITSKDFYDVCQDAGDGDLVFLDPPYQAIKKTNQFNQYSPGGFSDEQQMQVRDIALKLHDKGAFVMITNDSDAHDIYATHDEFPECFRISKIEGKRRINSDSSLRSNIGFTDIIATNIPTFWRDKQMQRKFDDFR